MTPDYRGEAVEATPDVPETGGASSQSDESSTETTVETLASDESNIEAPVATVVTGSAVTPIPPGEFKPPSDDEDAQREFEKTMTSLATYDEMIDYAVEVALRVDVDAKRAERNGVLRHQEIVRCVLDRMNLVVHHHNATAKARGFVPLHPFLTLPPRTVARVIMNTEPVVVITPAEGSGGEGNILALYRHDGPRAGTYHSDEDGGISRLIRLYNPNFSQREVDEVLSRLSDEAPHVQITMDTNVIVVGNGLLRFNPVGGFTFEGFTPEIVVQSKIATNFVPNAPSPQITMPDGTLWDFDSWLLDIAGNDELRHQLLWWMIASVLRPRQGMDFLFMPHNVEGNNGKGTLLHLLRQIIGPGLCASVSLGELGTQFGAHGLLGTFANLVDENGVGSFSKDATVIKAVVTHDPITINRKNKSSVSLTYLGTQVQCVNEIPRFMDKSDSLFRRFMPIPFPRSFKGVGVERKYIKHEYMARSDVREYVLWQAMSMDLSICPTSIEDERIPQECRDLLGEVKSENNPVVEFFEDWEAGVLGYEDFPEHATIDQPFVMPNEAVYDCYVMWLKKNRPTASKLKPKTFHSQFARVVERHDWWQVGARVAPEWTFADVAGRWMSTLADRQSSERVWAMTYTGYAFNAVELRELGAADPSNPHREHVTKTARSKAQSRTTLDARGRWRGYAFDPKRMPEASALKVVA